jgi:hypothetical protein
MPRVWSRAFNIFKGSWLPGKMLESRASLSSLGAQLLRYWFKWKGFEADVIVVMIEPNETSLPD